MNKYLFLLLALLIVFSFVSCSEKVQYSADDFLTPFSAGQDVDIPEKPAETEISVDYRQVPEWEKELEEVLPVFREVHFNPSDKPTIKEIPLEKGKLNIEATVYHKTSSELIYTWMADNLVFYNLKINRNLPDNEDPLIWIPADMSGSLQVTDGNNNLKIEVTAIEEEPGWVQVSYNGTILIPAN